MAIMIDILKQLGNVPIEKKVEEQEAPEVLTAEILEELNGMTSSQLAVIYKHGKRNVRIDNDPRAYAQLNDMTTSQLEAIFGSNN